MIISMFNQRLPIIHKILVNACYTIETADLQYHSFWTGFAGWLGFYFTLFLWLGKVHGEEFYIVGHMTKAERAGK